MTKLVIAQVWDADALKPLVTVRAEAEARLFLAADCPEAKIGSLVEPTDCASNADTGSKAGDIREHPGVEWQALARLTD